MVLDWEPKYGEQYSFMSMFICAGPFERMSIVIIAAFGPIHFSNFATGLDECVLRKRF